MQLFKKKNKLSPSTKETWTPLMFLEQVAILWMTPSTKSQNINVSEPPDTPFKLWGWPDPQHSRDQMPARSGSDRQQKQGKNLFTQGSKYMTATQHKITHTTD